MKVYGLTAQTAVLSFGSLETGSCRDGKAKPKFFDFKKVECHFFLLFNELCFTAGTN